LGISNCASFNTDLFRSTDGGATWQRIGDAQGGDKEWMVIDTTTSPGRGNIYQNWQTANSFGSANFMFTRSTDGGASWMTPIAIPHQAIFGTVDIGPNGEVYVIGYDANISQQFWVSRSSNVTNAAATPSFDLTVAVNLGGAQSFGGI